MPRRLPARRLTISVCPPNTGRDRLRVSCIDPSGGLCRRLEKLMQNKERVRKRMHDVNASMRESPTRAGTDRFRNPREDRDPVIHGALGVYPIPAFAGHSAEFGAHGSA
jgi:hypothetical protein